MKPHLLVAIALTAGACKGKETKPTSETPAAAQTGGTAAEVRAAIDAAVPAPSAPPPGDSPPPAGWERKDLVSFGKNDPIYVFKGTIDLPTGTKSKLEQSRNVDDATVTTLELTLPSKVVVRIDERPASAPTLEGPIGVEETLKGEGAKILDKKQGATWFVVAFEREGRKEVQGAATEEPGMDCAANPDTDAQVADAVRVCASLRGAR
jgi:hypothetical protein